MFTVLTAPLCMPIRRKVGYEIPFTRYFYKYQAPQPSAEIMAEILELEKELEGSLQEVFDI